MPRVDLSVDEPKRPRRARDQSGGGVEIPSVYGLLREQERVYGGEPDPRWRYWAAGKADEPYPAELRGPAHLLADLESGRPVQVSWQRLTGLLETAGEIGPIVVPQRPDGRIERFLWGVWRDRSIVGLFVDSDDVVVPLKGERL